MNILRMLLAILLIAVIVFTPLSICRADDPEPSPSPSPTPSLNDINPDLLPYDSPEQAFHDAGLFMVWLLLNTMGIEISVPELDAYGQTVEEFLWEEISEFLDSIPGVTNWHQWILPWLWEFTDEGNYIYNNSMLDDVMQFGQWLVDKWSLTDNSSETAVVRSITINDIVMYGGIEGYFVYNSNPNTGVSWEVLSGLPFHVFRKQNNLMYVLFWSTDSFTIRSSVPSSLSNPAWNASVQAKQWRELDWYYSLIVLNPNNYDVSGYVYYEYSQADLLDLLSGGIPVYTEPIVINTTNIIFPDEDPEYTTGDSLIIFPDGSVGYLIIDWPDHITVDNYPSVISPASVSRPEFNDAIAPIKAVLNASADGVEAIRGVIYELPEVYVMALYAIIGAIILLGMIKLMREH